MPAVKLAVLRAATALLVLVTSTQILASERVPYSLENALSRVEQANHIVIAARRNLAITKADVLRADVGPNPSVSAGAFNTSAGRYRPSQFDQIVRIEQTFERGDKRALRVQTAALYELAANNEVQAVIRQQQTIAAFAYFELASSQNVKRLANENLINFQQLLEAAEKRLRAGDIASVDVSRLKIEVFRATSQSISTTVDEVQASQKLAFLIGQESQLPIAADALPQASEIAAMERPLNDKEHEAAVVRTSESRSDVLMAKARLQAQNKALLLARSLQTRDITLGAQTERAPGFNGRVFGLSASIPLYVNNDFTGEIVRADAELAAAQSELNQRQALVRAELATAYAVLNNARNKFQLFEVSVLPQAAKIAQAMEFAYSKGAATLTDILDAKRQFNAVQLEAALVQSDFAKAMHNYKASIVTAP
jgi:outer membrane protein, heavy metal efflux system